MRNLYETAGAYEIENALDLVLDSINCVLMEKKVDVYKVESSGIEETFWESKRRHSKRALFYM